MTYPIAEQSYVDTQVAAAVAAAIAAPHVVVTFSAPGTVTTVTGALRWRAKVPCTIQFATADVNTASSSGSVIVDILKNGTSIFTSTAHRPTIPASAFLDDGVIDITSMAVDDLLTVNVTSAGTGAADLTVNIWLVPLA
jgi:hypothetical protein